MALLCPSCRIRCSPHRLLHPRFRLPLPARRHPRNWTFLLALCTRLSRLARLTRLLRHRRWHPLGSFLTGLWHRSLHQQRLRFLRLGLLPHPQALDPSLGRAGSLWVARSLPLKWHLLLFWMWSPPTALLALWALHLPLLCSPPRRAPLLPAQLCRKLRLFKWRPMCRPSQRLVKM